MAGLHLAAPALPTKKPSSGGRGTSALLTALGKGPEFLDPKLPKGTFSHSQYFSYLACGKAYEFKYVLGLATPSWASTTRGVSVHKGIEEVLKAKMLGQKLSIVAAQDALSKEFDLKADEVLDWGEAEPDKVKKDSRDLLDVFYLEALPKINPLAIEKGFAVDFAGVPMVGYIDLIDEVPAMDVSKMSESDAASVPKKKVVVDFKTKDKKLTDKDVRNNTQMTLYAAVEKTPHIRMDLLVTYKKGAVYLPIESERTSQDVAILEEHVASVADHVRKGDFPMAPIGSWACSDQNCAFWSMCRGRKY
jgi:hypothetical protein